MTDARDDQVERLPTAPDDDSDFTPALGRKIIAAYQAVLSHAATRIQQLTARVDELERERDEARSQRREWQTASALDRAKCQAAEASLAEAERVMDYLLGENSQVHPMFGGCPNIRDLCFTVFMRAHDLNDDDGGPTDWANDTVPLVNKAITAIRDKAARAWLDSRRKEQTCKTS